MIFVKLTFAKNITYNNSIYFRFKFYFFTRLRSYFNFQWESFDPYGKKLDGVQVIVKKDNQPFKQSTTSGGKYDAIEAPFGLFTQSLSKKMVVLNL